MYTNSSYIKFILIIMKQKLVNISFNKDFFAKSLLARKESLRYVFFIKECLSHTEYRPAIRVLGISGWVFDIERGEFVRIKSECCSIEKARVSKTKTHVLFQNENHAVSLDLADFYRQYSTRVANTFLC